MSEKKQFVAVAAKEILASLVSGHGGQDAVEPTVVIAHRACDLAEALYSVLEDRGYVVERKTYLT